MMTKGIIYLNVLNTDSNYKLELQQLKSYAKKNKIEIISIYNDEAYSPIVFDRPYFKKLVDRIHHKEIDILLTSKLKYIGEDLSKVLNYLNDFKKYIKFISLIDNISSDDYEDSYEIYDKVMEALFNAN